MLNTTNKFQTQLDHSLNMISDLQQSLARLTQLERQFLENMTELLDDEQDLTINQYENLKCLHNAKADCNLN